MKRNRKYNIFGWLSAAALLLTTGCAETSDLDAKLKSGDGDNIVTFTIAPERGAVSTRAGEKPYSISDGSQIDLLVFAVYERTEDDGLKLLEEYQKEKNKEVTIGDKKITAGPGQNVVEVKGICHEKYTYQFVTDPKKEYVIAFWAQSSKCDAYDTSDLTKVEVKYKNALNNDESRDAFCGNYAFKGSERGTHDVILYRPFAQLNIGTAGWDYEGAAALHPSPTGYTESKVVIEGVARFYDVTGDAALDSDNKGKTGLGTTVIKEETDKTDVTFDFAKLPAFIHIPAEKLMQKREDGKERYEVYDNEEFLVVNLDEKMYIEPYYSYAKYKEYLENKDRQSNSTGGIIIDWKGPYTETFKYLSMSYILVPEAKPINNIPGTTNGAVLNSVAFYAKGLVLNEEESVKVMDKPLFTINNVPAQKNWRTNIVGDSFFVTTIKSLLYIVPDYMGDYNNLYFDKGDPDSGNDWDDGNPNSKPNDDFPEKDKQGGDLRDDYFGTGNGDKN